MSVESGVGGIHEADHTELAGINAQGCSAAKITLHRPMPVVPPPHCVKWTGGNAQTASCAEIVIDHHGARLPVPANGILRAGFRTAGSSTLPAELVVVVPSERVQFDPDGRRPAVLVPRMGKCTDHLAVEAPGAGNGVHPESFHGLMILPFIPGANLPPDSTEQNIPCDGITHLPALRKMEQPSP